MKTRKFDKPIGTRFVYGCNLLEVQKAHHESGWCSGCFFRDLALKMDECPSEFYCCAYVRDDNQNVIFTQII